MAATFVTFKNLSTGDTKKVKLGISWSLLMFAPFFGIPLFSRRFYKMAIATAVLSIINIFALFGVVGYVYAASEGDLNEGFSAILVGFVILFVFGNVIVSYLAVASAVIGNKWTAMMYYKNGWKIIDGDLPKGKLGEIEMAWAMPEDAFAEDIPGSHSFDSYPR